MRDVTNYYLKNAIHSWHVKDRTYCLMENLGGTATNTWLGSYQTLMS